MSPTQRARLPRYRRGKTPPNFQLTDRDVRVLDHLHKLRLLERAQIQRLEFTPGGTSACKRRLTLLYHHQYIDRRYAALNSPFGAARSAYCLDRRGAELVASRQGRRLQDLDWRRGDMDRDALFFAHLLDTNDAFVSLFCASHRWSIAMEWLSERELRRDLTGVKLPSRTRVASTDLVPIPDAHAVVTTNASYGFAIELDRGTVEELRIRRKVLAYGEWIASGAFRSHLPGPAPRVLFVVAAGEASSARVERLMRWCAAEGGGSLFWFAEHAAVRDRDALCDAIWAVPGHTGLQSLIDAVACAPPISYRKAPPRIR